MKPSTAVAFLIFGTMQAQAEPLEKFTPAADPLDSMTESQLAKSINESCHGRLNLPNQYASQSGHNGGSEKPFPYSSTPSDSTK